MLQYLSFFLRFIFLSMFSLSLSASPTSLFWTPAITDILDTGSARCEFDSYFSLKKTKHLSSLPTDLGMSYGLFTFKKWQAEAGFDYMLGPKSPLLLNFKMGTDEDAFMPGSPSLSFGIYEIGFSRRTNENILNFVVGKTLSWLNGLKVYGGGYHGNTSLGPNQSGILLGCYQMLTQAKDSQGNDYDQLVFSADYASGKNSLGAGSVCLSCNLNPEFNIQTGAVFFNDASINGKWKWSLQMTYVFPVQVKKGK